MRTPTPVPSAPPAPGGVGVGEAVAASLVWEAARATSVSSGGTTRRSTGRV